MILFFSIAPSEMTALEYVITSAQEEIARLDLMIENILVDEGPERFVLIPNAKFFFKLSSMAFRFLNMLKRTLRADCDFLFLDFMSSCSVLSYQYRTRSATSFF